MKKILCLALAMIMVLSLAACGQDKTEEPANDGGDEKAITLRFSSNVSSADYEANNTPMAKGLHTWIDTIEAESNGSIKVELFLDGQLAKDTDGIIGGLQNGAFDVTQLASGNWAEYTKAFVALATPYMYKDAGVVHSVIDGDFGAWMFETAATDVGVKPLAVIDVGFRQLSNSKKTITCPADLSGIKIRTMSDATQIAAWEALGCSVSNIPFSELFTALQQKLVDAQENPLSVMYANKLQEVQQYVTLTNHAFTATVFMMNNSVYDGLSDAQKSAVDAANAAAVQASRDILDDSEQYYLDAMKEAGCEIYEPTADEAKQFQDAVAPAWDQVAETIGADAYTMLTDAVAAAN